MKFSAREDIKVPIDFVFAYVSDFKGFERQALRRGIAIRRMDDMQDNCAGMLWDIQFTYRGKLRVMKAELEAYDAPQKLVLGSRVGGLVAETVIELVAMSPHKTRIFTSIDLKPKSIPARLLLQSLRLAKGSLTKRYKARVKFIAEDIETQYRAAQIG